MSGAGIPARAETGPVTGLPLVDAAQPAAHPPAPSSGQERGNCTFGTHSTDSETDVCWKGPWRPTSPAPCSKQMMGSFHSTCCEIAVCHAEFTGVPHVVATSHLVSAAI